MALKQIAHGMQWAVVPARNLLQAVAAAVLALMMLLTALDVALRYLLNRPIPGGLELVEYMMAVVVPFSVAVTAFAKGHIGVDLVMQRFPARFQALAGCLTTLGAAGLYGLITWQAAVYIGEESASGLTSAVLRIPQYPFIAALALAFALLSVITLMQFFQYLAKVVAPWTRS